MKEQQYEKARAKLEEIRIKGPHPWGSGGFSLETPKQIVEKAEREGYSDKDIERKLGLQYGIRGGRHASSAIAKKIRAAEEIAHSRACEKGEIQHCQRLRS